MHAQSRDGNLWTETKIAEMKLKESLLQAMRRNGAGVRVPIKNFVAAAELVKHDQAQCFDDLGGRL